VVDRITIKAPATEAIALTASQLVGAVERLRKLEWTEAEALRDVQRLKIVRDGGSWSSEFTEGEKALLPSMWAAAKRRAAEIGREKRAAALDAATDEIERLRAVLCQQAAAATIELAEITRDARERG